METVPKITEAKISFPHFSVAGVLVRLVLFGFHLHFFVSYSTHYPLVFSYSFFASKGQYVQNIQKYMCVTHLTATGQNTQCNTHSAYKKNPKMNRATISFSNLQIQNKKNQNRAFLITIVLVEIEVESRQEKKS